MEETTRVISSPIDTTQSVDLKLSTLLLATIQEAKDRSIETKDRVSQIEHVFLAQLYPLLKSKSETLEKSRDEWKSKESNLLLEIEALRAENQRFVQENRSIKVELERVKASKGEVTSLEVRVRELERMLERKSKQVDEGMELHTKLVHEVKSKDGVIASKDKQLRETEESRSLILGKVGELEKRADELQKDLREKIGQVAMGNELKQNLFRKIESQASEIVNKDKLLNDLKEEKRLILAKLNHMEEKVGQLQKELVVKSEEVENCAREKKLLLKKMSGLKEKVNEAAERRDSLDKLHPEIASITSELLAERTKYEALTVVYKRLKSQHIYLRSKYGLTSENMLPQDKLEDESDLLRIDQNLSNFYELQDKNQHASPAASNTKKLKNEISFNNNLKEEKRQKPIQGTSTISPTSVVTIAPKCPSTVKSVPVAGRKRAASSWIDTRSRQGQNGPDPHDDFLDTPIENIRANLNRPTKEQVSGLPVPVPVSVQDDVNLGSSDDETQDVNADQCRVQKQHMPVSVSGKSGFKYVEPVRKKAERENLKGVECKQCKKFYDAVLPDDGGKGNDNGKHDFRCEHHEGVSRHRYRYLPPSTPEGFWNIGFESEM